MDRLSIWLTFLTGPVLTGIPVIILFTLNYYEWPAIAFAITAGMLLSWPAAYALSRHIKRKDPKWDETKAEQTDAVPRPGHPEV
ncbi:MAG: hypothetical protein AAFQ39_11365 [Pseudomonadota bacterium]